MPKGKAKKSARRSSSDEVLTKKVLALRAKDKKWSEIADELGITPGKAQFLQMVSEVRPKDRIKYTDDEDLADKVVEARDEQLLSWGLIAARSGVSEGKIKRLYDEAGGKGPKNVASARKGDDTPARKGRGKAKASARTRGSKKAAVARKGKGRRRKGGKKAANPSTAS